MSKGPSSMGCTVMKFWMMCDDEFVRVFEDLAGGVLKFFSEWSSAAISK